MNEAALLSDALDVERMLGSGVRSPIYLTLRLVTRAVRLVTTIATTRSFLRACWLVGYNRVTIEPNCIVHAYFPQSPEGPRINGWPAIWDIAERLPCGRGCGSGGGARHQEQTKTQMVMGEYVPHFDGPYVRTVCVAWGHQMIRHALERV